jgi:hypothetical protein
VEILVGEFPLCRRKFLDECIDTFLSTPLMNVYAARLLPYCFLPMKCRMKAIFKLRAQQARAGV